LPVDTVLSNAKIIYKGNLIEAGIAIENGKIVKIAKDQNLPKGSVKINLNGKIILPGLIDAHVHLRDQQLAYKENFLSGTSAAAAGGITLVMDMPNNEPVTMSSSLLKQRIDLAKESILVNTAFYSALPKTFEEMTKIIESGAIGFKIYLSNQIGGIDVDDDKLLLKAFKIAANEGIPIAVHAEDNKTIEKIKNKIQNSHRDSVDSYVEAHSPEAEAKSITRIIKLIKNSRVHIHFCHLSSEKGLNTVKKAKKMGLSVSCEVTPHNLLLTNDNYIQFGFLALTDPPLRKSRDVLALWNGLKSGTIDLVASDHAPHSLDEKKFNSVWDAKPGIPGLETMLSLLLTQVNNGKLSLSELVKLTSQMPAKIFNLKKRGSLEKGNWADIVVVDINNDFKADSSFFWSKAKYSPFDKMHLKGKPIKTFVNGKLIFDNGEIVAKPGTGVIVTNHD
jgi:dihydroorotase (multifunctional complex type)